MEQLAKYFTPELYEIELRINKDTEQVQGRVKIQGVAKSSTVKLHAKNLKINQLTINQRPVTFTEDAESETISFASQASDAEIIIEVRYSLQLSHGMTGLYLSTYASMNPPPRRSSLSRSSIPTRPIQFSVICRSRLSTL